METKRSRHKRKQIPFRLSEVALEILAKVQEKEGLGNRTSSLEVLLRDYAKIKEIKLDGEKV